MSLFMLRVSCLFYCCSDEGNASSFLAAFKILSKSSAVILNKLLLDFFVLFSPQSFQSILNIYVDIYYQLCPIFSMLFMKLHINMKSFYWIAYDFCSFFLFVLICIFSLGLTVHHFCLLPLSNFLLCQLIIMLLKFLSFRFLV